MDEPKHSIIQYILFKVDRTITIVGLIAIAIWALISTEISEIASKIVFGVITALATYLGSRGNGVK